MENINIEKATSKDVGLILTMIHELAAWEGYSDEVEADEALLTESLFGAGAIATVLIAYIGELPVGYMIYCPKLSTYTGKNEIYLQDIYLREQARGSGSGRVLMSELAKIALNSNATRIEWFVDKKNTKALSFYRKLGAQVMDEISVVRLSGVCLGTVASCREGA